MSQPNRCPQCGAELPSGALGGLCPKCLLAAGLESRAEAENAAGSGSQAPTTPHSGAFTPPDAASLAAHFPQLEILELLGHGGMGAVYKARQPKLDRLVALKIIRPESADDPAFAERFNREARMLARLSHPRIVAVYDFGEVSVPEVAAGSGPRTLYFFLMEYVEGTNLRQLLQAGELLPQQALAIVPQICEALQFAHDEGIVHRDIKPENILLDKRGRVKIADFGLAKLAAGSREEFTLTGTHQVMGTPRYMAPEQMEGSHAVDHRADIYSLGVVFYEMLTGEVPMGHFDPPSQKVEVDVRLDSVILRTLARQPERRYQHASEVKTDVESISRRTSNPPMTAAGARAEMDEGAPRLSRKAVLGAWAVALSVAAAITVFVAGTGLMALHEEQGPVVLQWWEYPILLTLGLAFLIGLIAPFAATILGIVAINEIRHSQGRLVGLGLAFFDAAFFPVVLVEGVIFFVCWALWAYVWWEIIGRPNYDGGFFPFWLLSSLLLSVPIAVLIRSWWRTAVGYTIDDVSLRRRIGNTDTAPRHEVAVRKPKRRYQHASDVKTDVDSILETSNRIIPAEAPKPASTYWKPSWTVYAAYSLVLALMLHAFLAALYGGDDFWNKGVAVAACLAIVGCSCLAYLVEKLGFDSRRPLSYARNLMSLVFGLVLLLIPTMVLSPVELNDWVPSAAKSLTPRDERYLRLLQLGMFLWTFYFVGVHVLNGLGRSILHKDRLPIGGEPEGEPASKVPRAKPDNEVARLVINPAWGLIITAVISWVTIPLAFAIPFIDTEKLNATQRAIFQISFGAIPLVVGTIMALAGFRMKRLEGYRLAMFAAVLPIAVLLLKLIGLSFGTLAIGPADLVGAPIGLWVLVVLTRSDVKTAFHRPRPQEQSGHVNSDLESSASERDELARFGDAPSKTEDFLLMNPRLPVAARWITVYAIVVRPLLWILVVWLGFLGIMSSTAGDHPESAIEHIVDVVAGFCGLVCVMIVAIGGVKLRALQHAGPRWIKIGLGLGFGFGLLMFIVHLTVVPWFVGPLRWAARYNPELLIAEGFTQEEIAALVADKMHPILIPDAISVFFVLLWLALDIAVFVWLWRNSRFLPLSDAKELPEPNPVEAAPAGPNSGKQRGTLGQAWDEWWAERDRWFTRGVLCVLLVVHLGCLAMFLTLRGGGGYDSDRPSAWHHVGWPTPWFVYERGVEPNVAFRRTTNLLSWSILVAGIGMLAWYAFWRIQLVQDARNARFWQTIGSPTAVLIAWIIAGALFAGLGVRAADRLYESMRAQVAPIDSPRAAESPGLEQRAELSDDGLIPPSEQDWTMTPDGPMLTDRFSRMLELESAQTDELNRILQGTYAEYLKIEQQYLEEQKVDDRHVIVTIKPHSEAVAKLEDRLWTQLDALLDSEQQRIARLNLHLDPRATPLPDLVELGPVFKRGPDGVPEIVDPVIKAGRAQPDIMRPGLGFFGWGKDGVEIEIWHDGTRYRWKVRTRRPEWDSNEFYGEAPKLPAWLRRFWNEPHGEATSPTSAG